MGRQTMFFICSEGIRTKALRKGIQCLESLDHQSTPNHNKLAFHANLNCLLGTQNRYSCLNNCLCKLFRALFVVFLLLSPHRILKKSGETGSKPMLTTINSANKTNDTKIYSSLNGCTCIKQDDILMTWKILILSIKLKLMLAKKKKKRKIDLNITFSPKNYSCLRHSSTQIPLVKKHLSKATTEVYRQILISANRLWILP